MKRFTVRLNEDKQDKLKKLADKKGITKVEVIRRLIDKEGNPAYFEIDTELLMNVYKTSEYEIPEKLKTEYKRLQVIRNKLGFHSSGINEKEKDNLAIELMKKQRKGHELEKEEKTFLDHWTYERRQELLAEKGLNKNSGDDNE